LANGRRTSKLPSGQFPENWPNKPRPSTDVICEFIADYVVPKQSRHEIGRIDV
jgi:hypothetical protein